MIVKPLEILAQLMAATHLNKVSFVLDAGGREDVLKRRRWYSPPVIFFGNWVSRMRRVPVHVLHNKAWQSWEAQLNPLVNGIEASLDVDGNLRVRRAAGQSLQHILTASRSGLEMKVEAIGAAARALRKLHATQLPGNGCFLSHGDATVRNVAYDRETRLAQWFDFDLAHDLRLRPELRQADDLRGLIFSALPHVAAGEIPSLAEAMLDAYGASPALEQLVQLLSRKHLDHDLFHLAQTLAGAERRRLCRAVLIQAINKKRRQAVSCDMA